jgi:hypothetical protein
MGLSVEVVRKPPKPVPEEVARTWAEEWAKEGRKVDWQRLMPPRGFVALPRRWVVERTFAWLDQNRRMSKDYERLCATSEAFIYAAITLDGEAISSCLGISKQSQKANSPKFAGKIPKDSPYRGCTSLSATLGFSDRHGPTEGGGDAMDMGTKRTRWPAKKARRCGFWARS